MKLSFLLILAGSLQVSAKVEGQNSISLKTNKVEIAHVLKIIERQGTYRFLYNSRLSELHEKVSLDITNESIRTALNKIFAGSSLSFKMLDNNLIVLLSTKLITQDIGVTGKITGESGEALPNVSVTIKGSSKGTTSDNNGNFTIAAPENGILVFSYIGYQSQELPVNSQPVLNVKMAASSSQMDQVVVIGYGTQKKRDLTGSIDVVKGEDVANKPSTNPVASLQGKVAGLTIVNSGQAGSSPTVRLRGVNSTNNADPLYIVDGIMQTNIDYVNQSDIESIEILKDPSSIAIYGLQGGNGVIIITTKRAKKGETRINFVSNVGVQKLANKVKVTDAAGFKRLFSEQLQNTGAAPFDFTNFNANTDWQDQIYRSAIINNNTVSVSNSSDKSTTYLSLGYSNQQGIEKFDKYEKYIGRLNEEMKVSKNIRVGGDLTGFYFKQNPPSADIETGALWAAPIVPIQAGPDLYYSMPSFQRAQVGNPTASVNSSNGTTTNTGYRVTGNVFAEIKFLKNFTWKSTFYTDLGFNQSRVYSPLPYHYIDLGNGTTESDTSFNNNIHTGITQSQTLYKTYQQDHTLTFDKNFAGGHHITVLAGFSTLYHYTEALSGNRTDTTLNVPNDPNLWNLNTIPSGNPGTYSGSASEDASKSFIGRVNYSLKNRYLLNVTYRRDGTSKFSPSHQWGNFGSVGAGWVLSDEHFMQNVKGIDFLKIKASWGTVGNGLNIGNYLSYPVLNNSTVGIFGNSIYPAITPSYIPDPNLHWEVVTGKDAGFELQALNRRLSLNVDVYDRKTKDILTQITIPSSTTKYFTNLGTIDNKGIEITAGWRDNISRDLTYSINGNFSVNTNKVVSIGDNFNFQIVNGINLTQSGYSIGYFFGYKQIGIFQTTAQLDKSPHLASALPGDIQYADLNKDGKITDEADRTYLGTPFPKYNFGFSLGLAYKGFDLSIDAQGVAGNKIYVQRRSYTFATLNYESNRLNAWNGAGTSNIEPIMDPTRSNNYDYSSYWLEPGDYLRLRNIQIGYNFKIRNPGIKQLHLFLSGQNIATFTKATGYSPEVPISNPVNAGIDNGVYRVPAVYTLGVNLTF